MSNFQLNLAALTESARDHLARLETSGGALRDRFRSPVARSSSGASRSLPSAPPLDGSAALTF
jgi:hypothetical protein